MLSVFNERVVSRKKRMETFDYFNLIIMIVLSFLTLYPFWYVLIGSFNEGMDYVNGGVFFITRKFTLDNYTMVLSETAIVNAYIVTSLRTFIGIITSVLFTSIFAYGFSRKYLKWKGIYAKIGLFTMYFGGGLIPYYLLLNSLGLINNFLVYIIPTMFNFYYVIILQSFFRTIPDTVNESAMIDGASEYRIFFSLILPLSKPVLAAIALFQGVYHWNSFFDSMVFTSSESLQTIQVYLMRIIKFTEAASKMASQSRYVLKNYRTVNAETIKFAMMVVTTLPILVLYPFLQKYFVKGIMIGSVKG